MLAELFDLIPPWALLTAGLVAFVAGIVKGAIGFALPLIIMSGLSLFLEPLIAVAGVILPALVSNLLQVSRHPIAEARATIWDFRRYVLLVCIMILIVAQFVKLVPEQVFYLVLGVPVLALSIIQLSGVRLVIPPQRRRMAEWLVGGLAGTMGGFTGTWGPPTVLYLMALDTPKSRQMLIQGVIYSLGSVSLLVGHITSGVFTWATATFSAVLLVPTFLGMRVGFWVGDRLDAELFRKATLIVLIVAGANLVRRGLFG
ncbi:sulfite exporter TauE/SafE family protein [Gymnodinialimonas sp. 2305UL16-5]|uniref:sulfite exporter TauE/SafE family protein n=1 Tax=Gymnodinialimonas mytili TaxID=3126503 RepID=UPI00309DEA26